MYQEFPFSLGLSGHSLFNVYNKSISLCYWMINQESRQRVPLNFHLLLVQQQCSSATYTKVRSRIIELNLFYLTIYEGKWSLVYTWSTQDSPTRRQLKTFSLVHKIYPRPPCRIFLCFCGRHSRQNETETPETNECLSTMSLIKV